MCSGKLSGARAPYAPAQECGVSQRPDWRRLGVFVALRHGDGADRCLFCRWNRGSPPQAWGRRHGAGRWRIPARFAPHGWGRREREKMADLPAGSKFQRSPALRACLVEPTSGSMGYTAEHEHDLSKQPFRCRVRLSPEAIINQVNLLPTATPLAPFPVGRPLLSVAYRLPLALPALQLSAVADCVLSFQAVLPHRPLDLPPPSVAGH